MSIEDVTPSSNRYEFIHKSALERSILEIGAGLGSNQLRSSHRELFLKSNIEGRYLGIDPSIYLGDTLLNIEIGDVLTIKFPKEGFDTILILDVIEHISIYEWENVFEKMIRWLRPGGRIYLSCPYLEPIHTFKRYLVYNRQNWHEVFGIDEDLIKQFLPDAKCRTSRLFDWRGDSSFVWAVFRLVKRLLMGHIYGRESIRKNRLEVVWTKEQPN